MKKTLLLISLLFSFLGIKAQDSQGGIPYSFNHPELTTMNDLVLVPQPDLNKLMTEDLDRSQKSEPYRIGVTLPINLNPSNSGTWTDLPKQKASLWQLTIKSEGAKSIGFGYAQFYMPEGAKLFLYNKSKSIVIGAYTSINNTENFYFANEKVSGDEITLELLVPNDKKDAVLLNITELNYFYRGGETENAITVSDACEVNVNCSPEGTNWQDEKKGVCKLDIRVGGTSGNWYNCSGSLVNNTSQNCTPYVLLADHCHYDAGYATTADYNAWVFYFHYESTTCTGTTSSGTKTKTGCTLKAHDTYGSNQNGSDFCLVQINTAIATSYNVYFNGWDRNNTASASGAGIHHPAGDIMKISTYTGALTSVNFIGGSGTHWQVIWAGTTNGHGVTEGGSSGSPIFNASGKIVGTLTSGSSCCTSNGCGIQGSGQTSPDYYGKMYYHWDKNGTTAATRLKDWLDPTNSGITSLAGTATCTSGIFENSMIEEKVIIFPSPANTEIYLEVNTNENLIEDVSIYNLMGVLVLNFPELKISNGKAKINISDLSEGLYFLKGTKNKITIKGEFVKIK
jgi:lysyl endopeptidase